MFKLRSINNCLSLIVVGLAAYIIVAPFLPQLSFAWRSHFAEPVAISVSSEGGSQGLPEDNLIAIPSIQLHEKIHEGQDATALQNGAWRRPHTSTPDQGSNTVVVGHRFTYNGPATFYHLDKIQKGDEITVVWEREIYRYEVAFVKVVPADHIAVEDGTNEPLLTLYTCTPLWSATERLVIGATPVKEMG
jgi:LPXTG-site transpeptidase (sortase) family protein